MTHLTRRTWPAVASGLVAIAGALCLGPPGTAATAPTQLNATVGPGSTIALKTRAGVRVASLTPGRYRVVVRDLSVDHNFTLRGPGVSKATSVRGTGATVWTVTLRTGAYAYASDRLPATRRAFEVRVKATTLLKVNANTASVEQLTAAFTANGVPNPDSWAGEVDEYRPYPTDDPTFAKLRQELSKYNPSARTLALILASLQL